MDVGDQIKKFSLEDHLGNKVSNESIAGKYSVFFFYPKDSTPGCTTEACSFRDMKPEFDKLNVNIFGISKDSQSSHQKFSDKQSLNFPLIVDTEGELLEMFGVWQLKKLYGREFMGIVRQSFIVGPKGDIVKKYPKVKVKEHVDEVLADIKEILA